MKQIKQLRKMIADRVKFFEALLESAAKQQDFAAGQEYKSRIAEAKEAIKTIDAILPSSGPITVCRISVFPAGSVDEVASWYVDTEDGETYQVNKDEKFKHSRNNLGTAVSDIVRQYRDSDLCLDISFPNF